MKYAAKNHLTKIKRILLNPADWKYILEYKDTKVTVRPEKPGILLVIHESQELGASILTLHMAEELAKQAEHVYIVSRQFGKMNEKYSKVAPIQIALTTNAYKKICLRLYRAGFRKALLITAPTGDLVRTTKECGFEVVSMIHELAQVIRMLHLEDATKQMLRESDKVLFSTSIAKDDIMNLLKIKDNANLFVKPQGVYFKKPSQDEIEKQVYLLTEKYPELKDKSIIAGVGNTSERKGFDIFLQTAFLMPDYEFVWAGRKENYFSEAVQKIGRPSNFIYAGSMNSLELSAVYCLANVYLMSSRFDTLPSTIFEALLFRTPVVGARDSGGIIDVINDINGYLTTTADSSEFKEAIQCVLNRKNAIDECSNSFEDYVEYVVSLYSN